MTTEHTVLVIGSGPAGLSCAAELLARGVDVTVVERGGQIGAAWSGRYDALRFNTCRRNSALPGAPFPRRFGQFPTRDQYVDYLQTYAGRHHVAVELGVDVQRLDPLPEGGWKVATNGGPRRTRHVVVATGIFNQPALPDWGSRQRLRRAGRAHRGVPQRRPVRRSACLGRRRGFQRARDRPRLEPLGLPRGTAGGCALRRTFFCGKSVGCPSTCRCRSFSGFPPVSSTRFCLPCSAE